MFSYNTTRLCSAVLFVCFCQLTFVRGQGIQGYIIDKEKEPVINAAIMVLQNDSLVGGTVSDPDGRYLVKPLSPGTYDIMVLKYGYDSAIVKNVIITNDSSTINFKLFLKKGVTKKSLYRHHPNIYLDRNTPTKNTIRRQEISHMPH